MAYIQTIVNDEVVEEHESTFGNRELAKEVANCHRGKDRKALTVSSRARRKKQGKS